MKNRILAIFIILIIFSCENENNSSAVTEDDRKIFENNWKAFEKHHVGGIVNEDLDRFLELYSDTLKWSPPNWNNNVILGKEDLKAAAKNYIDNFENLSFEPGGAVIGGEGAYWGGNLYSDTGQVSSSPNSIRVYGVWSGNHSETGAPFHLKFYIIQQFNEDGKVVSLNEWFDPSSLQVQIEDYVSKN